MSENENKDGLLVHIEHFSRLLRDGRYDEIDLTEIEKEAPEVAENFKEVIENLRMMGNKLNQDSSDFPTVQRHLDHISRTTEDGVMNVINMAETMMNECGNALDIIHGIASRFEDNEEVASHARTAGEVVNSLMDKCFSIITAVEFDDINRQLMVKLLNRLNLQSENLMDILMSLNLYNPSEADQSAFIEELKHIIDLDGGERETQESIDELFEAF